MQWPYTMRCIRQIHNSAIFSSFFQVYTSIFSHAALLRHVRAYWDIIKVYSGIFRTFYKACICRNLAHFESWNIQNWIRLSLNKYSLTCRVTSSNVLYDIQNLVYYCKFRHIQAYSRAIPKYSVILWHI